MRKEKAKKKVGLVRVGLDPTVFTGETETGNGDRSLYRQQPETETALVGEMQESRI